MFDSAYVNRNVFVTGHTGFKGSWLCAWLENMGASVCGYALEPPTTPNHFECLDLKGDSVIADVRDFLQLQSAMRDHQPEIIFHLAAQPSVLVSYDDPIETFSTNVVGTVNLLQAVREIPSVRAVVIITTDKCYENKEWLYGYRETDPLGGHDPYSASKACTELVVESFRKSYFGVEDGHTLLASARAGNVIGGGDWTADRLLPDIARAASEGVPMTLRNPNSSRPWQHVLEPLSGYLRLGQMMLDGEKKFAEAWNFGPSLNSNLTTSEMVDVAKSYWSKIESKKVVHEHTPHEAGLLMVDSTKANRLLQWEPIWDVATSVEKTVMWYRTFFEEDGRILTSRQIDDYCHDAEMAGASWTI